MGKIKVIKDNDITFISAVNDKYEEKIEKLQKQIEDLQRKIYKYKVGDCVILKDYRVFIIKEVLYDNKYDYMYKGDYQIGNTGVYLTSDDILGKYLPSRYVKLLQDALVYRQASHSDIDLIPERPIDDYPYETRYKRNFEIKTYQGE